VQIGRFAMVALVAVALEFVRRAIDAGFDWIKYAGAAYLAWLGIRSLLRGGRLKAADDRAHSLPRHIVSGFVVTWTNPKAFLFFGAFLPQFVDPALPAVPQVLFFGLLEMAVAAVTDTAYALLAVFARDRLGGPGAAWLNRIAGTVLICAALWLALQTRG
jgi:threonine/homoserine/homoserine lactone efflux protein